MTEGYFEGRGFVVGPDLADATAELATYTRAVGGTDPHPVTVERLIGHIDAQVDTVWAHAESRGTASGAEAFLASVRELTTLSQSLEGRAAERVEILQSTAEALLAESSGDGDVIDEIYGGSDDR